jgi:hypothetical protein
MLNSKANTDCSGIDSIYIEPKLPGAESIGVCVLMVASILMSASVLNDEESDCAHQLKQHIGLT